MKSFSFDFVSSESHQPAPTHSIPRTAKVQSISLLTRTMGKCWMTPHTFHCLPSVSIDPCDSPSLPLLPSSGNRWHSRYFPTNKTHDSIYGTPRRLLWEVSKDFWVSKRASLLLVLRRCHIQTFPPALSHGTKRIIHSLLSNAKVTFGERIHVERMTFAVSSTFSSLFIPNAKQKITWTQKHRNRKTGILWHRNNATQLSIN